MNGIDRRRFLQGMGAATALTVARPWLPRLAWAAHGNALDPGPFPHGVASGDPTPSAVMLWTRVEEAVSEVTWQVALDPGLTNTVAGGTAPVGGDGTVLVDVTGLAPGTTYWYRFSSPGGQSRVGRTKTAPLTNPSQLRFAIASCQHFESGFYHAWEHIAARAGNSATDLDFVVFLGDYIYEDPAGDIGAAPGRTHSPAHEILTLDDYRTRYRNYRSDPHLRDAHALYPFIVVWDDHEVANDRWGNPTGTDGGAENHQETEGPYATRLANAMQAFFEYMPLRRPLNPPDPNDPNRIYRSLSFGDPAGPLVDLFMLDTRSYRNQPKGAFFNPAANFNQDIADPNRTILGNPQKQWLKDGLATSVAQWKVVGNQVMIGHLNFASLPDHVAKPLSELTKRNRDGIPVNHDQWDGYQPERREVLEHIRDTGIDNVVFVTGDIHTSWVHELTVNPAHAPVEEPVAVEFVGPSISSDNLNELVGELTVGQAAPHRSSVPFEAAAMSANRHLRYVELDSNGYTLITVTPGEVRADYYHVVNDPGSTAQPVADPNGHVERALNGSWVVSSGETRVRPVLL